MHKLESGFEQNNKLPLYESKNLVNWKTINEKVDLVIGKEKEEKTKNEKPENIIENASRVWGSLDEKGVDQTKKDLMNAEKLIAETEKKMKELFGKSAWSCFADDGR